MNTKSMNTTEVPPMDHKIKRPNGRWVPAVATDIRKTFERERARLKTKGTRFYLRDEKEL